VITTQLRAKICSLRLYLS